MLIFDSFPSKAKALEFVQFVRDKFTLSPTLCETRREFNRIDTFPSELVMPVVVIERQTQDIETQIELAVLDFDGTFAGT